MADDREQALLDDVSHSIARDGPRPPRHHGRLTGCVTGFRWVTTGDAGARESCQCQRCQQARDERLQTLAQRMGLEESSDRSAGQQDRHRDSYDASAVAGESTSTTGP